MKDYQGLGLQPGDHRLVDVEAVPAAGMQLERALGILGDRRTMEPADLFERRPAQQRRGTAEEGSVPFVEAFLHEAVEHLVLGRKACGRDVLFDRVRVQEKVRGLNQEQLLVDAEEPDRFGEEILGRDMVGIEHGDDLAVAMGQAVVEVAGLGMVVLGPGEIADAEFGAEGLHVGAAVESFGVLIGIVRRDLGVGAAVIEQEDIELAGRVGHPLGSGQRRRHDLDALVVGRDEDVDRRSDGGVDPWRLWAIDRVGNREQAQEQHGDAVEFRDHQNDARREVARRVDRRDGAGEPPEDVTQNDERPQSKEYRAPRAAEVEKLDQSHGADRRGRQNQLCFYTQW